MAVRDLKKVSAPYDFWTPRPNAENWLIGNGRNQCRGQNHSDRIFLSIEAAAAVMIQGVYKFPPLARYARSNNFKVCDTLKLDDFKQKM